MRATLLLWPASPRAAGALLDMVYDPPRRPARPAPANLRPARFDAETVALMRLFGAFVGPEQR